MKRELVAPCGMNCVICKFHYRKKNTCPSCRELDKKTPETRFNCIIRECKILKDRKLEYCSDKCDNFPCKRLISLDKRYRTKYHMSMLENLDFIKENKIKSFLEKEKEKWTCSECSGIVTCHGGMCLQCGFLKFSSEI